MPHYYVSHHLGSLENLAEIVALERVSFATPWSQEGLREEIVNPLNLTTIIKSQPDPDAGIIGYSLSRVIAPEAELLRIAIKPQARHQGIGTRLIHEVEKKLLLLQVKQLYLEVSEKNRPAIALYQKTGFSIETRRPNYYDNGTTGAIIFTLKI